LDAGKERAAPLTAKDRLDLWAGEFGNEYHSRNELTDETIESRRKWLMNIIGTFDRELLTRPKSMLEIGCGRGANLAAIWKESAETGLEIDLYGIEPNIKARLAAAKHASVADVMRHSVKWPYRFDLVLTCGLLIHIPPAGLDDMLDRILDVSSRYILLSEYFAPQEEEVPYQGQEGALWRRDYGSLLMERGNLEGNPFRVEHIAHGFLWRPVDGLDNLTYWLFEKVPV
jgi:SAM-dependent methyltransferase